MTPDAVLLKMLDALDAGITLLKVQVDSLQVQADGIRQRLETMRCEAPRERRQERPERCTDVPDRYCALQSDDAQLDRSGFGVNAWQCRGCGHREEGPAVDVN